MTTLWGAALVVGSGVTLALLGVWAFTLRPATTTTRAFGFYAVGTGAFITATWSAFAWPDLDLPSRSEGSLIILVFAVVLWAALILLVLDVPRPLRRDEMRLVLRPAILGIGFFALVTVGDARVGGFTVGQALVTGNWAATFAAIGIAIERFRGSTGPSAERERHHIALLAIALCLIIGEATGRILIESGRILSSPTLVIAATAVLLGLAVAWLTLGAFTPAPSARHARDVTLLLLGAWVFGGLWEAWGGTSPAEWGSLGIATLVGGILLARGALVGNLLGADVQLRWGISKSTVAASFIAVFFVASEAAQQLFGAALGGAYAGIMAAGALVFAMAPLQRAAERFAETAVPVTAPAAKDAAAHEDAYRASLRLAMRGGISRREEFELARIAEAHGISFTRALMLRDEVEREIGVAEARR